LQENSCRRPLIYLRPRTARTPPKFRVVAETKITWWSTSRRPSFIHPTKPDGAPTLLAALRELLAFELVNGGQVSIVNRLDRETSGLVLIAKMPRPRDASARNGASSYQRRNISPRARWPEGSDTPERAARAPGRHGHQPFGWKQTRSIQKARRQ
jgi:23S rRNA pseudouridine1911/1915/1917 synthase